MDQISPPMRIVLAVAVVFLAAYMLVLRPKDETSEPATTPSTPAAQSATDENAASTGPGKAVESARGAAAATEAKQNASSGEAATTKPSTSGSTPSKSSAPAKPADESLAKLPEWLQTSIDDKVVAILFTNGKASDDRRTRNALKQAFTAHGKVVKRAVPITRIARYRPVAQGVDVQQSPTLMVIDRKRQARSLVGYSSVDTINQAIIDGLLATAKPVRSVPFLQTVQRECRQVSKTAIIGPSEGETVTGYRRNVDATLAALASSLGTIRNAPTPAAYRPAGAAAERYLASELAIGRQIRSQAIGAKTVDNVKVRSLAAGNDKVEQRAQLELNAVGVSSCN